MQTPDTSAPTSVDTSTTEAQTFRQWSTKRFEIYQNLEQQAQSSIANVIALVQDFAAQMETESAQLLTRYHQERSQIQAELEALRREVQGLQQDKARLTTECEHARDSIATYRQAALSERDKIMSDAYAERDRVLAEVQQIVLQQIGQGMFRVQKPPTEPIPPAVQHPTDDHAPFAAAAMPTETQVVEEPHTKGEEPHAREGIDRKHEPVREEDSPPQPASNGVGAPMPDQAEEKEQPAEVPVQDEQPADVDEEPTTDEAITDEAEQEDHRDIRLIIEGVESFILASELIDSFESCDVIEGVNLTQYEQSILQLSVQNIVGESIEDVIHTEFGESFDILAVEDDGVRLRYRNC